MTALNSAPIPAMRATSPGGRASTRIELCAAPCEGGTTLPPD
ncbi:MAG: hypothetical protein ACLU9X_10365 [Alistipes shahii]